MATEDISDIPEDERGPTATLCYWVLAADRLKRAGAEEEAARRRLRESQERISALEAERARAGELLAELRRAVEERRARAGGVELAP